MSTLTENRLAEMWAELLNCENLPRDVDFLALSGDSLSAMACIARVQTEFNVELLVEDFFISPATIESLGRIIDELRSQVGTKMPGT
jgi:yersiniabactin nonribosomal peptide synthetase